MSVGADGIEDGGGDADLCERDVAAEAAAGVEEVAGLAAEEGDGAGGGYDRGVFGGGLSRVAIKARRHVDGENGDAGGVGGGDDLCRFFSQRAGEAGAEQGVDDQAGVRTVREGGAAGCSGRIGERAGGGGFEGGAGPAGGHVGGVAFEVLEGAEEQDGGGKTPILQEPGSDEAVAAVVAGAAQNKDGGAGGDQGGGSVGDGAAGVFHEREAGDIKGDGALVGLAHFRGGQQLVHDKTMFRMRYFSCCRGATDVHKVSAVAGISRL